MRIGKPPTTINMIDPENDAKVIITPKIVPIFFDVCEKKQITSEITVINGK